MFRVYCIIIGYFIGCIQSAYVVGKFMHVDIRKHGSGNLGSTNALRVLGKRAGAVTFICDIVKSVCAYFLCSALFGKSGGVLAGLYACTGVVLGHDFPFYLRFCGGKGIASMIGMMMSLWGIPTLITYGFGIAGLFTRYVSVGSLLFSVSIPFAMVLCDYPKEAVLLMGAVALLAAFRHKANIERLAHGNENRLGAKKEA